MTSLSETIARLRELLGKATPGPLSSDEHGDLHSEVEVKHDRGDDQTTSLLCGWDDGSAWFKVQADVELIAAMRNALPELLDAAEASIERNGSSERGASEVQASAHTGEPREHGEPVHDAALITDLNDWKESGISRGDVKLLEKEIADLKAQMAVVTRERDELRAAGARVKLPERWDTNPWDRGMLAAPVENGDYMRADDVLAALEKVGVKYE